MKVTSKYSFCNWAACLLAFPGCYDSHPTSLEAPTVYSFDTFDAAFVRRMQYSNGTLVVIAITQLNVLDNQIGRIFLIKTESNTRIELDINQLEGLSVIDVTNIENNECALILINNKKQILLATLDIEKLLISPPVAVMDSDKFQEPVYLSNGSQIRIQEGRNNPIDIFDNAYTSFSAVYRRKSVNLMMYYQGSVRLIKRDTTNGRTSMQTIVPRIEDDPRNIPWAGLMRTDDVRVSFCVSYFASESIALKVFWKTDIIENQPGILCSEIDDNDAFQNIKALPIPGTLPADMTYGGSTSLLMENFSSLNKDKISLREFDYSNNSKSITQLIIETDENTRGTSLVQAGRCIYIGGEHGYIQVSSGSVVRPGDAIIIKSCNGDQKVLTWGTERRDYVTSLAQGDDENLYVALIMGGPLTHDPPQDRKQLALIKRISPFSFAN